MKYLRWMWALALLCGCNAGGEPCYVWSGDCDEGEYCYTPLYVSGVCTPLEPAGESCRETSNCAQPLECVESEDGLKLCMDVQAPQDAPCGDDIFTKCITPLTCSAEKVCQNVVLVEDSTPDLDVSGDAGTDALTDLPADAQADVVADAE